MIKANEIRIGNWINYKGEPIPVTMIGMYGIQSKTDEILINAKFSTPDLSPIPLTPEILEKAGFEKIKKGSIQLYKLSTENYMFQIIRDIKHNEFCFDSPHFNYYFTSVHHLQNLFKILTGEELTVNVKELTID